MSSVFDKKILERGEKVDNLLIAEIKYQMRLRNWTNKDLADAIGYKTSTVNAFFTEIPNRNRSEAVEKAICKVLNIVN